MTTSATTETPTPTEMVPLDEMTALQRIAFYKPEALNVDEIDACIADYEASERLFASAKAVHDDRKALLIQLVQAHGSVPPHAEQSKRILGRYNVATITSGTTTSVHEEAVNDLGEYCAEQHLDGVFEKLFATEVKHKLIDGARNVLSTVPMPKRRHEKVLSLFGRCFDIKPKAPSLKVTVIEPVKAARKPRTEKAAA